MTQVFYMVWNPKGRSPSYRHEHFTSAKTEAQRLAKLHPDDEFIVLQSVGAAKAVTVQWNEHSEHNFEDGIPF